MPKFAFRYGKGALAALVKMTLKKPFSIFMRYGSSCDRTLSGKAIKPEPFGDFANSTPFFFPETIFGSTSAAPEYVEFWRYAPPKHRSSSTEIAVHSLRFSFPNAMVTAKVAFLWESTAVLFLLSHASAQISRDNYYLALV